MKLTLANVQAFLIYTFVFLGPLGNLLTPALFPSPFRTFYFILPLFPLFFAKISRYTYQAISLATPVLGYILLSGYLTELTDFSSEEHPFFRSVLFVCQFFFMLGMSASIQGDIVRKSLRIIHTYLFAFFISLVIGYSFYIGFYTGHFSINTIKRFSVLTQFGYGILRFSPGSYPNEYGIVASFALSVLTFLIAERKNQSYAIKTHWSFYLFYFPTLLGLILTTTRAAYFSFALSLLYLITVSKRIRLFSLLLALFFLPLFSFVCFKGITLFTLLSEGIKAISFTSGSTGLRFREWIEGVLNFNESILLGMGWGSAINLHNTYLQLLFELGIIGTTLLVIGLTLYLGLRANNIKRLFSKQTEANRRTLKPIIIIGLIHTLFFALTNHNLHHHLTWLTFCLCNAFLVHQHPIAHPKPLQEKRRISGFSA